MQIQMLVAFGVNTNQLEGHECMKNDRKTELVGKVLTFHKQQHL